MKVELLGKGSMGMVYAECYKRIPGIEIVRQTGRISPRDHLKDSSIDAVDVCFPTEVHRDHVVAALNNGKHVFCETPLALNIEDADAMISASKYSNKILMVGLLIRSIAEYQEIERRVKAGELGKVISAHTYRLSNYLTPGSQAYKAHYSDVVSELMTFDFDYLNLLFGIPKVVDAKGELVSGTQVIGAVTATLDYPEVTATVEASAIKPLDFPFTVGIEIIGEEGSFKLHTEFHNNIPETTLIMVKHNKEEKIDVVSHDPYEYELRYFKDCVEGKADPGRLSAERAREALELVLATRKFII